MQRLASLDGRYKAGNMLRQMVGLLLLLLLSLPAGKRMYDGVLQIVLHLWSCCSLVSCKAANLFSNSRRLSMKRSLVACDGCGKGLLKVGQVVVER